MSRHLLKKYSNIHDITMGTGMMLRLKDHKLHKSSSPVNNLYWTWHDFINDKSASLDDFKYMDYEDPSFMRIKRFKKGY